MVRVGVIGAGYLGAFHIDKFLSIKDCDLVGVVEVSEELRDNLKKKFSIPVYSDYRELLGLVDAVSIVVPTPLHYEIASFFIKNNVHTFIEKPVTETVEQGGALLSLSNDSIKVQVGHIERFNPVYNMIKENMTHPKSVIIRRKAPFTKRGADVDVVFDLMIHDIDIVLNLLTGSTFKNLSVIGNKFFTSKNDYVKADFSLGQVSVTLETSRVYNKKERTITVVCDDVIFEGDFINQDVYCISKNQEKVLFNGKKDILLEELQSFIHAIKYDVPVKVTLSDGYNAVVWANQILSCLEYTK